MKKKSPVGSYFESIETFLIENIALLTICPVCDNRYTLGCSAAYLLYRIGVASAFRQP